jgi:Predicted acyl-CoA transferases/carnitine dehydratase
MADTGRNEGAYLQGIRVLELADETGEYGGRVLAGLGADVVKVEPPEGETTRRIGPFRGDVPSPEESLHFWHYNLSASAASSSISTSPTGRSRSCGSRPPPTSCWMRVRGGILQIETSPSNDCDQPIRD